MGKLDELRVELDAGHPDTGVYSADAQVAEGEINLANRTLERELLASEIVRVAVDPTEYNALTVEQRQEIILLLQFDAIDLRHFEFGAFRALFGPTSTTITNMTALRDRAVGRAEELGLGSVRAGTIEQARAL